MKLKFENVSVLLKHRTFIEHVHQEYNSGVHFFGFPSV